MKKIIAVVLAIVLVLSLTSCMTNKDRIHAVSGKVDMVAQNMKNAADLIEKNFSSDTGSLDGVTGDVAGDEEEPDGQGDEESQDGTEEGNNTDQSSSSSSSNTNSQTGSKTTSKSSSSSTGNSTSDIIKKYVSAAKATDKNIKVTITKTLNSLNGGTGAGGSLISKLESIAKKALANKSGVENGVRGNPDLITAADISKATISSNATYTNINLIVKDYTAKPTGRNNEGSVGHVIGVLDTLDEALKELPLETVGDTSNVRLKYTGAKVVVNINNKTNKIVSALWEYDVNVIIPDDKVKLVGIPMTLKDASAVIHYKAVI